MTTVAEIEKRLKHNRTHGNPDQVLNYYYYTDEDIAFLLSQLKETREEASITSTDAKDMSIKSQNVDMTEERFNGIENLIEPLKNTLNLDWANAVIELRTENADLRAENEKLKEYKFMYESVSK